MEVFVQQGLKMCYIQSIDWADFSKLPCRNENGAKVDKSDEFWWKFWKMGRNSAVFGPIWPKFCMVLDQCLGDYQLKFRPIRPKNGRVMEVFVQQGLIMCYIQSSDWADFSKLPCPRQKVEQSGQKNAFQWFFWKMGRNSAVFGPIWPKFCMVLDQCLGEFQ